MNVICFKMKNELIYNIIYWITLDKPDNKNYKQIEFRVTSNLQRR